MQFPKAFTGALVLGVVLIGAGLFIGISSNLFGKAQGTITGTIVLVDKSASSPTVINPVIALPGDSCSVQVVSCAADTSGPVNLNPINASTSPSIVPTRQIILQNNVPSGLPCKTVVYDSVDNIANGNLYSLVNEGCTWYENFQGNANILANCDDTATMISYTYVSVAYSCQ